MKLRIAASLSLKMSSASRCRSGIFLTVVVAVFIALGYGEVEKAKSKSGKKDESVYAEMERTPRKARERQNPLERDPEAVAAGGKLFAMHCAECHGETAEGGRKAPSLLANEIQQASPGTLFWILTNGVVRRGMPVWSKLPELQRWQIVSYIKSLSTPIAKR